MKVVVHGEPWSLFPAPSITVMDSGWTWDVGHGGPWGHQYLYLYSKNHSSRINGRSKVHKHGWLCKKCMMIFLTSASLGTRCTSLSANARLTHEFPCIRRSPPGMSSCSSSNPWGIRFSRARRRRLSNNIAYSNLCVRARSSTNQLLSQATGHPGLDLSCAGLSYPWLQWAKEVKDS